MNECSFGNTHLNGNVISSSFSFVWSESEKFVQTFEVFCTVRNVHMHVFSEAPFLSYSPESCTENVLSEIKHMP